MACYRLPKLVVDHGKFSYEREVDCPGPGFLADAKDELEKMLDAADWVLTESVFEVQKHLLENAVTVYAWGSVKDAKLL